MLHNGIKNETGDFKFSCDVRIRTLDLPKRASRVGHNRPLCLRPNTFPKNWKQLATYKTLNGHRQLNLDHPLNHY